MRTAPDRIFKEKRLLTKETCETPRFARLLALGAQGEQCFSGGGLVWLLCCLAREELSQATGCHNVC
jgi:hypothetical protein